MATLSQALRNKRTGTTVRGLGGQLSEEAPEEIQSLAGQAGLQAPPTTPLGGAALGANPDQQKMMGTPAQKQAALSLSQAPVEDGLQGALRRRQVRTEQTGQEQQQTQKNTDMQNLGNLGDRVTQFIDTQRKLLEEQQAPVDVAAQVEFQGQDISSLKDTLAALRADPNNMQLQLEVNKALGRNINSTITPDEVNRLYEDAVSSIAKGGAANVDDSLTVSDLVTQQDFGYDAAEIAQLLGLTEQQVAGLSVGQLRNEIQRIGDQEFSTAQGIEQQAQSMNLGQAERGLARQAGREASQTGVRATEAQYQDLEKQITNADQVTFGGKNYKVDDLLKDETISGIISEYMNAPEGSDVRKAIEQNEPGLKAFIDRNKAVLETAAQALGTGATSFTTLQETNTKAGTLGGALSSDLAKALVPGFGELAATALDPNSVPVLAAAQSLGPDQQRAYGANIQAMSTRIPEALNELKELSKEDISKLGFQNSSGRWANFVSTNDRYNEITNTPPANIADTVFNIGRVDPGKLRADVANNNALKALGFGGGNSFSVVDADGDGQVDSGDSIKARLAGNKPSLKLAANDQLNTSGRTSYVEPSVPGAGMADWQTKVYQGDKTAAQRAAFERMAGAASKGYLTPQDIAQAYNSGSDTNVQRIYKLHELNQLKDTISGPAQRQILDTMNQFQAQNAMSRVQDAEDYMNRNTGRVGVEEALKGNIETLNNLLNSGDFGLKYKAGEGPLRGALDKYRNQLAAIEAQRKKEYDEMIRALNARNTRSSTDRNGGRF